MVPDYRDLSSAPVRQQYFSDDGDAYIQSNEAKEALPEPVLKGAIKSSQVFDDPYRSARGRTITHAFYIELNPDRELPEVKGGDDARQAMWVPLADLDPVKIFEDHYFVIQEMTGL